MPPTAVLAVTVADVRCAIALDQVREVVPAAWVEPLPDAPAAVMGVLDLRGELLAVVDARNCLGLSASPLRPSDRFVVVASRDRPVVLRVDSADEIMEIPGDAVTEARTVAPDVVTAAGIARLSDGMIVIHDPDRFLSSQDSEQLRRALLQAVEVTA